MTAVNFCLSPKHVTRFNAVVTNLVKKKNIKPSFGSKILYTKVKYFTQFFKNTKVKSDNFVSPTVNFKEGSCSLFHIHQKLCSNNRHSALASLTENSCLIC